MSTVAQRLNQAIEIRKSTPYAISKHTGVSQSTIGRILKGESKTINRSTIASICNYLNISEDWLLGQSDVMSSINISSSTPNKLNIKNYEATEIYMPEDNNQLEIIKRVDGTEFRYLGEGRHLMITPLVEQYAYAGYTSGWADPEFIQELPKHAIVVDKLHFGIYRTFETRGESMDNGRRESIANGDLAVGRKIDRKYWTSKLHLHKFSDYVIVKHDGIIVKRIIDHNVEEGILTCTSLNPDKQAYPDFTISLNDVSELFNVVSVTQKR